MNAVATLRAAAPASKFPKDEYLEPRDLLPGLGINVSIVVEGHFGQDLVACLTLHPTYGLIWKTRDNKGVRFPRVTHWHTIPEIGKVNRLN